MAVPTSSVRPWLHRARTDSIQLAKLKKNNTNNNCWIPQPLLICYNYHKTQACSKHDLPHKSTDKGKNVMVNVYSSLKLDSPLWELTCHVRSHSKTCHPAEVTFHLHPSQLKVVLALSTLEGCKDELTKLAWLHTEVVYPSQY